LPDRIVIGLTGVETVLATCTKAGAIAASAGEINQIATPTLGWQIAINAVAATTGNVVEDDPTLRIRQSLSTALPSQAIADGIMGAVFNVAGVTKCRVYNNDTDYPNEFGIPAHNLAVVALGGDPQAIAEAIAYKKPPGVPTYGQINDSVTLPSGPVSVNYWQAQPLRITGVLYLQPKTGYTAAIGQQSVQRMCDFINALGIGEDVYANESGAQSLNSTYFHAIRIAYDQGINNGGDVFIRFNSYATATPGDIRIQLV
jgi:uncharacterized phage protein gp47/JayE